MATEVLTQPREQGVDGAPAVGWVDRLVRLPVRLPGPALLWYAALALVIPLLLTSPSWLTGDRPVGSFTSRLFFASVLTAYSLGSIHLLNGIARSAFRDFRPALGQPEEVGRVERLAADLTSLPDRAALRLIVVLEVLVTAGFFSNSAEVEVLRAQPPAIAIFEFAAWWIAIAALALLILQIVRQLRMVSTLHAQATSIDLFAPGPIIAFARLTSATAIDLLIIALAFVLLSAIEGVTNPTPFEISQRIAFTVLAVAVFLVPLRGMHQRMAREKARLEQAGTERLKATIARIHGTVDADELARADQLNKTLASLLAERDVIGRLSTWPWSPGILRGFASAVLLPIGIWFLIRLLEGVL